MFCLPQRHQCSVGNSPAGLAWEYPCQERALSCRSGYALKLSEATGPDKEIAITRFSERTKGKILIMERLAPYIINSVRFYLLVSFLTLEIL